MTKAKREDWKTLEPPPQREDLGYSAVFSLSDVEKITNGLIPIEMEDKWFIFFSDSWLYFHRSWTGALIYALKFDFHPDGVRVIDSWVNRDPEQYGELDFVYDRRLVDFLIRALLLGENTEFPIRKEHKGTQPNGIYQHRVVGRAYPETTIDDPSEDP